jgi:carotenoid cleavage dioxygenase-like enzyme
LAVTDFHVGNKIHVKSLRTLGNAVYNDSVKATWSGSHSVNYFDRLSNQEVIVNWIGTKTALGAELSIYKMGKDFVRHVVGSVNVGFVPYSIHSISIVDDRVFLVLGPVGLDFLKAGVNLCLSCSVDDKLASDPTTIYVFSLLSSNENTKPVATISINKPDNFFNFHSLNAFPSTSDKNIVYLDLCVYKSMDGVLGEHVLGNLDDITDPTVRDDMPYVCDALRRIQIDIKNQVMISYEDFPLQDVYGHSYRVELASPNPAYANKPYCFVYSPSFHVNGSSRYEDMGLLKIDLCTASRINKGELPKNTSTVMTWSLSGVYVGEPIFVPNPKAVSEDDGVLLVVTREETVSKLRVFDAKSLNQLAEMQAPFPLPFEFHGKYFGAI